MSHYRGFINFLSFCHGLVCILSLVQITLGKDMICKFISSSGMISEEVF